jgi:hypothetical protein
MTMNRSLQNWRLPPLLVAGALTAGPAAVAAAESTAGDDWQYAASIYLWGAGIKGETAAGSEVDIGFDTLIQNLNMAFMGAFEARRSQWSFLTDVIYLNVGADGGGKVPVPVAPNSNVRVKVDADVKTKGWVLNLLGGYNLAQSEQGSLDLIAGARYLDLKLDFGLGLGLGPYARSRDISVSGSVWDAIVGIRGYANLNDKWYLPVYLDVGTGQSDLTWQASAGLAYRFGWGDVSLVYRHIDWELESTSQLDNINFSGPLLAAKFRF